MRILALETSGLRGSVAALEQDKLLAELELNPRQRSAQSLAPAIKDILAKVGWQSDQVQLVAVAVGPGSFTGLRIGVTTAKTFAYAVGAEVAGVNTLEAIAHRAPSDVGTLWAVIDAYRQQVFAGQFKRNAQAALAWVGQAQVLDNEAWLSALVPGSVVSGPALTRLASRLPPQVSVLPPELWNPTAADVGRLAAASHAAGKRDDLWRLTPLYLRGSAAEEKRAHEQPSRRPPTS